MTLIALPTLSLHSFLSTCRKNPELMEPDTDPRVAFLPLPGHQLLGGEGPSAACCAAVARSGAPLDQSLLLGGFDLRDPPFLDVNHDTTMSEPSDQAGDPAQDLGGLITFWSGDRITDRSPQRHTRALWHGYGLLLPGQEQVLDDRRPRDVWLPPRWAARTGVKQKRPAGKRLSPRLPASGGPVSPAVCVRL